MVAELIPVATTEKDGLMSAYDKKIYPIHFTGYKLLHVTHIDLSSHWIRQFVMVYGTVIGTLGLVLLSITTTDDGILHLDKYVAIKPYGMKVYYKGGDVFIGFLNGAQPFNGYVQSTWGVKETDLIADDSYTEFALS